MAALGGRLCIVCGEIQEDGAWRATASVMLLRGGEWTAMPPLPTPRWGCTAIPDGEAAIIAVGGSETHNTDTASVVRLQLGATAASTVGSLLQARSHPALCRLPEGRLARRILQTPCWWDA